MKRKFTLSFTLFVMFFSFGYSQVVFDPAYYPEENLGAGMSIVDIEGTKYLKVALDGWSTSLQLDPDVLIMPEHSVMMVDVMYEEGTSGYATADVNTFLKLADPDWTEIVASGAASSNEFTTYTIEDIPAGSLVGVFQFAGQETTGWSAVTGDTMYIGKVTVEDPTAIFDPALTMPDYLPDGWTLDTIDNEIFFQIVLNGWSSGWQFSNVIGTITSPEDVTAIKAMAKYAVGTSGYPLEEINTFLKFADASWAELTASGAASSADLAKYSLPLAASSVMGVFQPAGQETNTWGAVTGDTLWVGVWKADMVEAVAVESDGGATTIEEMDGTLQLTAVVTPEDVYNDTVIWSSSDEAIATVDETGLVTAMDDGTVTITATAKDGSGMSGEITLTISNQNVGVENHVIKPLNVYPNPATDVLYLENLEGIQSLSIFNITGKLISTLEVNDNRMTLDVAELPDGVYMLRGVRDDVVHTARFIK